MSDFGWGIFGGLLIGMFVTFAIFTLSEISVDNYNKKLRKEQEKDLQESLIKRYNKASWDIFNKYPQLRLEDDYIELSWEDFKAIYENQSTSKFDIVPVECKEFDIKLSGLSDVPVDEIKIPCLKEERGACGSKWNKYIPILFSEARYVAYWLAMNRENQDKKRELWQKENRRIDIEDSIKTYLKQPK